MRTDLTNLMADISVACTLMCCCCLWKSVGPIYDVRSTVLAGSALDCPMQAINMVKYGNRHDALK